jgi:hypothetical protein
VTAVIHLRLRATGSDWDRLERATAALRDELLELDVEDVVPASGGQAPAGTRAMDMAQIGELIVTLAQASEALRQVVAAVRGWLARDTGGHSAELIIGGDRLTVTGVTEESQQRLIEAWLRAHALDASGLD